MTRYQTTLAIANALKAARANPDAALLILENLLDDQLTEQQGRVLALAQLSGETTSTHVAKALEVKHNHASGLLKELYEYGLLERERHTDANGLTYKYRIAKH